MKPTYIRLLLVVGLLLLTSLTVTASLAQDPPHVQFLPFMTRPDPPGWIGPDGGTVMSIVADPANHQIMYAATYGGGVFKSWDEGVSWSPMNNGLPNLTLTALAIDPHNSNVLVTAGYKDKIYRTVDGGASWQPAYAGLQQYATVYDIAFDPVQVNRVLAATRGLSNNNMAPWKGVIYLSTDGGATWDDVLRNVGGDDHQDFAYSLDFHPTQTWKAYAAFHQLGPWISLNFGNDDSWHHISADGVNGCGRAIGLDPNSGIPGELFYAVWPDSAVCHDPSGLFISKSDGPPWDLIDEMAGMQQKSIEFDHLDTSRMYIGTFNYGLMLSDDNGLNWEHTTLNFAGIYSIFASRVTGDLVFAGTADRGLYRSLDGGETWAESQAGLHASNTTGFYIHPETFVYYASTYGGGVDRSLDQGQTWSDFSGGLGDAYINALVAKPGSPNVLMALTSYSGMYCIDLTNPVTWTKCGTGLPLGTNKEPIYGEDHPFASFEEREAELGYWESFNQARAAESESLSISLLSIAFAPSDPNTAYIGTGGNGVLKSIDGGLTWTSTGLGSGNVITLAVNPSNKDMVFAGTSDPANLDPDQIWVTMNGGTTWTSLAKPGNEIYTLVYDSLGNLYVGTNNGLYRLKIDFSGWDSLGFLQGTVTAVGYDPQQPSHLYLGTSWGTHSSIDGGLNWVKLTDETNRLVVRSFQFDPRLEKPAVYILTTSFGIYRMPFVR